MDIYNELLNFICKENLKKDEPMKNHTSFKIGGCADFYINACCIDEIKNTVLFSKENNIPLTVIGNGTNILVKDNGIRGIVLRPNLKGLKINYNKINISSGEILTYISKICMENELTGMEFACGIPGTIGGAIKMNAGAYGSEIKDILVKTTYINECGEINVLNNSEHNFNYRDSIFNYRNWIILETEFELKHENIEKIKSKMNENMQKRIDTQPVDMPSAGSTFKRGNDFITAKLIDECGLKGFSIGGAQVSNKHAGFIVNTGNATANDVLELVNIIKEKVNEKFNKNIEMEIKVLGE